MGENRRSVLEKFEEQSAKTNARVAHDIEAYRKGDAKIAVRSKDGASVEAEIKVTQKSHAFKHGANLFMLDDLGSEEKNQAYRKYFADAFNIATLPFYWSATEPEKGVMRYDKDSSYMYRRPPAEACMEYCAQHGIEPREHALAYERTFPKWLYGADSATVKRELERRYAEISERYAKRIPCIEVTNEHEWGLGEGKTTFYSDPDMIRWSYDMAARYFPDNEIAINEWGNIWGEAYKTRSRYYLMIENALLKGTRIDAIGMQFHMLYNREDEYNAAARYYDPANLFETMDAYAGLGKPLQISEITIPSYSWEKEDEEIQAEIIDKLYHIWFSHPAVEQIIYWNLVDGYACCAEQGDMSAGQNYHHGGLLRFDLTPKPAYETIRNLFQKEWHTEEMLRTNGGNSSFRGFYVKYDVAVTSGGRTAIKEIDLKKGSANEFTVVL